MTRGNPKKQKENYAELETSPSELLTLIYTAVGQYATHISKYPKLLISMFPPYKNCPYLYSLSMCVNFPGINFLVNSLF